MSRALSRSASNSGRASAAFFPLPEMKPFSHIAERLLQLRVDERLGGVGFEMFGGEFHAVSPVAYLPEPAIGG
jgi:hypothetical protein